MNLPALTATPAGVSLREVQRLPTSAARAVEPFTIDGVQYLAIAQLSADIPGTAPGMGAGDSDVDLLVYRWEATGFTAFQRLPVPGGEDAESSRWTGATSWPRPACAAAVVPTTCRRPR